MVKLFGKVERIFNDNAPRPLTYRARRTTRKAALMIFSAWAISAIVWPPSIVAWPYIEGERTVPSNDCYVQVRSNVKWGEAPWSSGERQGLRAWAMVLGREFNSQVRLKTRWIRRTSWWQKNKNNKDSQKRQVTPKKYFSLC